MRGLQQSETRQKDDWYGDLTQSTLWQENKPVANRVHPTMKPVELVARALANSSRRGQIVLDPFGGSGTTLIACHMQGRAARLMEIEPRYADAVARRWQQYTGEPAVLNGVGGSFEDVSRDRGGDGKAELLADTRP